MFICNVSFMSSLTGVCGCTYCLFFPDMAMLAYLIETNRGAVAYNFY
ncbi:DUF4260 family protein [Mechercharimyces sp. CAU 1602]